MSHKKFIKINFSLLFLIFIYSIRNYDGVWKLIITMKSMDKDLLGKLHRKVSKFLKCFKTKISILKKKIDIHLFWNQKRTIMIFNFKSDNFFLSI